MPRRDVTYALSGPFGQRTISLSLDPGLYTQEVILGFLDSGRLYEAETSLLMASILHEGDAMIDVGAHVGWFSMLAAAVVGRRGEVWALEPEPRNFSQLVEHIGLNRAWHVHPLHMAASLTPGVATFHLNAGNDGGHSLGDVGTIPMNEEARANPNVRQVYVTSLDAMFAARTMPPIRVLKIDAEGFEHQVLMGAQGLLKAGRIEFVIAEMNHACFEVTGTSEDAIRAYMDSMGYDTYAIRHDAVQLVKLAPDQHVPGPFVFNLVFKRRD
jgi:FkbM family methyltransferase